MQIYKNNGSNLIAASNDDAAFDENSKLNELFRMRVYQGINYYIKISGNSDSVYHSSDSYKLRCKVYALKPARIFTVDEDNNWIDDFERSSLINTREDANVIIPSLWSMSYTATEYLNNSANAATSVYSTSDIIVVSNHGAAGEIGYNNSILYGSYNKPNCNTDRSLYYDVADASELDLVIYSTCYSGVTSTYGNLVNITLDKGAYACIGWTTTVPNNAINDWYDKLFDELATGKTVAEAITKADNYVATIWDNTNVNQIQSRYFGESSALDKLILGGY